MSDGARYVASREQELNRLTRMRKRIRVVFLLAVPAILATPAINATNSDASPQPLSTRAMQHRCRNSSQFGAEKINLGLSTN